VIASACCCTRLCHLQICLLCPLDLLGIYQIGIPAT
jgi:hypothetical protein